MTVRDPHEHASSTAIKSDASKPRAVSGGNTSKRRRDGPQGTMISSAEELNETLAQIDASARARVVATGYGVALVGVSGQFRGKSFTLGKNRNLIGRNSNQDIILNQPGVSAMHAEIVNENGDWKVVNLLSSNGTFVNGKKVSIARIKSGDRIRFGTLEFEFADTTAPADSTARKGSSLWLWLLGGLAIASAVLALLF